MSLTPHAIGDLMITGGPVDLCCPEGQKVTLSREGFGWVTAPKKQKESFIL